MTRVTPPDPRAAAGQLDALHRRYGPALHRQAARHLHGSGIEPDDVLQDVWVKLHRLLETRPLPDHVEPWLRTVVRNACVDALRGTAGRRTVPLDAAARQASGASSVPGELERAQALRDVLGDIGSLEPRQRAVFEAHVLAGRSHEEIAAATGDSAGAIKGLVHRARRNLQLLAVARATPCSDVAARAERARARGTRAPEDVRRHLRVCHRCAGGRLRLSLLLPWAWTGKAKALAVLGLVGATAATGVEVTRTTFATPGDDPMAAGLPLRAGDADVRHRVTLRAAPDGEPRRVALRCPPGRLLWQWGAEGAVRPRSLPAPRWIALPSATLTYDPPRRDVTAIVWAMCRDRALLRRELAAAARADPMLARRLLAAERPVR